MPDREKVMRGLEHCALSHKSLTSCDGCVYYAHMAPPCIAALAEDALALIKKQAAMLDKACEILGDTGSEFVCDELAPDPEQGEICEGECGNGPFSKCWKRYLEWKVDDGGKIDG